MRAYTQEFMDGIAQVREVIHEGKPVTLVEVEDHDRHIYHLCLEGHNLSYNNLLWEIYSKLQWVLE